MKIKKASFWKRLTAMVIDLIILSIVSGVIEMIFHLSKIADYWISFGLFYAYNIFMDWYHQQTVGKMILKIIVIKTDGNKPSLSSSFYRNFGKIVSAIPLLYGYFRILAPHQGQTAHDEIGRCLVIDISK